MTSYSAVEPVYEAMKSETLQGIPLAELVGGGDPLYIGSHLAELMVEHAGLNDRDPVLDLGCGCGRLAAALTQHLGREGSYIGLDIVDGLVAFAERQIAAGRPNFAFRKQRQTTGSAAPSVGSVLEAAGRGAIDLCVATSLLTHFDGAMALDALASFKDVLAPSGRAFVTAFLLDPITSSFVRAGKAVFGFRYLHAPGI